MVATNDEGTSRGSDRSFTTLPAGTSGSTPGAGEDATPGGTSLDGRKPELGRTVALERAAGTVRVRRRGSSRFVPLTSRSELPVGSVVDAGEGALRLTSALPSGATQSGRFGGGRFLVRQGRRGYVDLYLRGRVCRHRAGERAPAAAAARRSRRGRRLWGRDRGGRFRTHGKNSHATVRGTRWLVEDRCAGTLTRVTDGSVVVRDKVRGRRVVLEAGERYLARPRG